MTSLVDAESVLAIDVGSVNTRALLFDVVDGQYHFIASGEAASTVGAPFRDISEGVHNALDRLQEATGRIFSTTEARLLLPSRSDGSGVDRLALTFSAGDELSLVTVGLLSEVSLQSAQRLAGSIYGKVTESLGLNDRRKAEVQLDAILQARPDVVIVAGGTERGATRSVYKLVELIGLACKVMPKEDRPAVLYCGNGTLAKRVKETLEREVSVTVAPNIRPGIDQEDLAPAASVLARTAARIRTRQVAGFEAYASLSSVPLTPSAYATGRMMRFLSEIFDHSKGIVGVDLGASSTVIAAGMAGSLQLNTYRPLGVGAGLAGLMQSSSLEDLARWVPFDMPESAIRDYLYEKIVRPGMLPMTQETLSIEHAAARLVLRIAMQRTLERWPNLSMAFDRVFLSGAVLGHAPSPAQSMMIALDGLQPVGMSTFYLDPHGLTQALGAISGSNTVLPVQVLDTGAYLNLGSVITPVSDARPGSTVLKIRVAFEQGGDQQVEVKQGTLVSLPVRNGQVAQLTIDTLAGTVLDPARPRQKSYKVIGGVCGVVVDTRGRPLTLPQDPQKRRETLLRWAHNLDERRLV
jgi:hypothetical protein